MNNKELGTNFEQDFCELLKNTGYWVHFITPDRTGAQPFDIIACKDNIPFAIDCKTLASNRNYFSIDRLELNQILAFERWVRCGNAKNSCMIVIKWRDNVYYTTYFYLKEKRKVDMRKDVNLWM